MSAWSYCATGQTSGKHTTTASLCRHPCCGLCTCPVECGRDQADREGVRQWLQASSSLLTRQHLLWHTL